MKNARGESFLNSIFGMLYLAKRFIEMPIKVTAIIINQNIGQNWHFQCVETRLCRHSSVGFVWCMVVYCLTENENNN